MLKTTQYRYQNLQAKKITTAPDMGDDESTSSGYPSKQWKELETERERGSARAKPVAELGQLRVIHPEQNVTGKRDNQENSTRTVNSSNTFIVHGVFLKNRAGETEQHNNR